MLLSTALLSVSLLSAQPVDDADTKVANVREARHVDVQPSPDGQRRRPRKTARLAELDDDIADSRQQVRVLEDKAAETHSSATNWMFGGIASGCGSVLVGAASVPFIATPVGWMLGASSCGMLASSIVSFTQWFTLDSEADAIDEKARVERKRLNRLRRRREAAMQY